MKNIQDKYYFIGATVTMVSYTFFLSIKFEPIFPLTVGIGFLSTLILYTFVVNYIEEKKK